MLSDRSMSAPTATAMTRSRSSCRLAPRSRCTRPMSSHMPPDVTACIFWMKNRMPERWRDVQNVDHVLGKYVIADRPMTMEAWAKDSYDH